MIQQPSFNIWGGGGGTPVRPPAPTKIGMYLSVFGITAADNVTALMTGDDGIAYPGQRDMNFPDIGRFAFFVEAPPGHIGWGATLQVGAPGYVLSTSRVIMQGGELTPITLEAEVVAPAGRSGVVSLAGHSFLDGGGSFFPLGTSLLWALGGWHRGEAARVVENFKFIAAQGIDYVRVLGQVDWKGQEIDPNWDNYEAILASVIDNAWQLGLRTQITLLGGTTPDPVGAARKVLNVVLQRREKVIMLEAVNEGNASSETAVSVAKIFAGAGVPFGVGLGNQGIGTINDQGAKAGANMAFYHIERTPGDNGARQVRQCWNFKDFKAASVSNEPPGPSSSVASYDDPFKHASMRLGNVICGAAAHCYHTGSGVFGIAYQHQNGFRYANLWEVPTYVDTAKALINAVAHLPKGIENWTKFNTGQPVKVTSGTVNKLYGSRSGADFAEIAIGTEGPNTLKADTGPCSLSVYNPATAELILSLHLNKGQTTEVNGLWSYLILGRVE